MKSFFTTEGLVRFQQRIANHLSHTAVNCEALCWATLNLALTGRKRTALDDMLRQAVSHLGEEPDKVADMFSSSPALPNSFRGMRDMFFIHILRRLPIMMHRTRIMFASPKNPRRKEIERVCLYCLEHYENCFQSIPMNEGKSLWKQDFKVSWSYLSWYTSANQREDYYYEWERASDCLRKQALAHLEWTVPHYARQESSIVQDRYREQLAHVQMHDQWLRDNHHVFLDQLADRLPGLYLLRKA